LLCAGEFQAVSSRLEFTSPGLGLECLGLPLKFSADHGSRKAPVDISLDSLAIFVAAATEKSFSATARRLGKAQSAVSTAIADLEILLGVTLFDRSGYYPVLSEAGAALLAEAESILSHCESLKERANSLIEKSEPRIVLGLEDAFPYGKLAPALDQLKQKFPEVRIDALQPSGVDLLEMVTKGKVLFGLGCARENYASGIGFCRVGRVTMVVAARHDHALAQMSSVRFATLADHLQLVLSSQTRHLFTSGYLKSVQRWQVQSQAGLLGMLRAGLGWAIVPKWLVEAELASGELVDISLQAYPFTPWLIGLDLIWNVETKPGIVAAWLKSELMKSAVIV